MQDRILSPTETAHRTSLHRTTIYRKVLAGEFPAPVRLSERRIGYRESDVRQWIDARASAWGAAV